MTESHEQAFIPWPSRPGSLWVPVSSSELELGYEVAFPFYLAEAPAGPAQPLPSERLTGG